VNPTGFQPKNLAYPACWQMDVGLILHPGGKVESSQFNFRIWIFDFGGVVRTSVLTGMSHTSMQNHQKASRLSRRDDGQ
jgi:hypothetical protein